MNKETWNTLVKPVVVLVVICVITSALLAVTNGATAPIIAEAEKAAAAAAYAEVLPEAEGGFEPVETSVENIAAVVKATNGSGYAVKALGRGYGGDVPVVLGFDAEGTIVNVKFLQNAESAGFGMKLWDGNEAGPAFAQSLVGKNAHVTLKEDGVDGISGATISSKAAVSAVNSAIDCIEEVKGAA